MCGCVDEREIHIINRGVFKIMSDIFRQLTDVQRRAMMFLRRELSDGQRHSVAGILQKAKAENISHRSLLVAKKTLPITLTNQGYFKFWQMENNGNEKR